MNVLCVMAHPDDEVLGAGGALAKHAENGDDVTLIALVGCSREDQMAEACKALGASQWWTANAAPDQRFETVPLSVLVDSVCEFTSSDVIYTHHPADLNSDHALTARAVLTAFRPKPGERCRTILGCEVLSSTEWTFPNSFAPNYFVALSGEQLNKKVTALSCYPTEVELWPHPRSPLGVRNLAAYRGQSIGVEAAEAFVLLRGGPY